LAIETVRHLILSLLTLTLLDVTGGHAQPIELSVSPRAGQLLLDRSLQDFRWDVRAQTRVGIELGAQRGAWSLALSADRAHTVQSTGIPGATVAPRVNWTEVGLQLRRHVDLPAGLSAHAGLRAGRLMLAWDPQRLSLSAPGVSGNIDVVYDDVSSWIFGPQLGLSWSVHPSVDLVGRGEISRFQLDTAYQSNGSIIEERRSFTSWQWSLGVAVHPWSWQ